MHVTRSDRNRLTLSKARQLDKPICHCASEVQVVAFEAHGCFKYCAEGTRCISSMMLSESPLWTDRTAAN